MFRLQKTKTTEQSASDVVFCDSTIICQTSTLQRNWSSVATYRQVDTAMNVYCSLFTCSAIQTVYIETTQNLQKISCIMAFQRSFSRHGLLEGIHSDINACTAKTLKNVASQQQRYRNTQSLRRLRPKSFHQVHPFSGSWECLIGWANGSSPTWRYLRNSGRQFLDP